MAAHSLEATFRSLKRRVLLVDGVAGLAWGFSLAVVALLVAVWMDLVFDLAPAARIAAVPASLFLGAVLLLRVSLKASQRSHQPAIARRLDQLAFTGGEILSGYELSGSAAMLAPGPLTRGLAEMATQRALATASRVPAHLIAPLKPLANAAIAAAILVMGLAGACLAAPRAASTEWLRFSDPLGDHPPYSRTEFVVTPGDTSVRYGDGLAITCETIGPAVDELELVLHMRADGAGKPTEEILPMFPESTTRWHATLSAVTTPGEYLVRSRAIRSRRYELDVITVPQIEQVRFRITPPVYTRDSVYEGPLPKDGLKGLAGTVVEIRAVSNRPLSSGAIQIPGEAGQTTVALTPTAPGSQEAAGTWTLSQPGSFHLTVTDEAGQASRDRFTGTISILKDQTPFTRLLEPAEHSLATPSAVLPVTVEAEDDYGVVKLQLFRSLNDSRALPLNLAVADPPKRRQDGRIELPLMRYGVEPGDVIRLFSRAEDNDPVGAKGAESKVVTIQIVSDEQFNQMLQQRDGIEALFSKYQAAQRRLEALNETMEQLEKKLAEKGDKELTGEEHEELRKLADQIASEAEAIANSAKHPLPVDLDRSLAKELEKQAEMLQKMSEDVRKLASGESKSCQSAAQRLAQQREQLDQERKEFREGVNDPLDQFAAIYPLMEDQARFLEIYYRQRDLAERLTSLKSSESPDDPALKVRFRELDAEQTKIRQDLEALLADIESHAALLPEDDERLNELATSAREFVAAVRESEAEEAMIEAATALAEFSGSRGHEEATRAADILETFLKRCQNCQSQCEGSCKSLKFRPGEGTLGDSLSQLLGQMGFQPGGKPGANGPMGAGGGFSAQRSGLNNVGLYGQMPARGNPRQTTGSRGSRGGMEGSSGQSGTPGDQGQPGRTAASGQTVGVSEAAVPPAYRRRVEEYFQRIADEASSLPPKRTKP